MLPKVKVPLVLGQEGIGSQHLSLKDILLISPLYFTALYEVLGLVLISLEGIMKEIL